MEPERPLMIEIISEPDYLVIRNNIQRRRNVENSNKQGLENLKSLYHYVSSKPVLIEENENQFIVKIPWL
jgi:hypothetical protein